MGGIEYRRVDDITKIVQKDEALRNMRVVKGGPGIPEDLLDCGLPCHLSGAHPGALLLGSPCYRSAQVRTGHSMSH